MNDYLDKIKRQEMYETEIKENANEKQIAVLDQITNNISVKDNDLYFLGGVDPNGRISIHFISDINNAIVYKYFITIYKNGNIHMTDKYIMEFWGNINTHTKQIFKSVSDFFEYTNIEEV